MNSKKKGNNFERKVAHIICDYFKLPYNENPRTPLSGGAVRWKGDIQKSDKLKAIFPFYIECKKRENWDLIDLINPNSELNKWWQKCVKDCPADEFPLLIFSKNYYPVFCMFLIDNINLNILNFKHLCITFENRGIMILTDFLNIWCKEVRNEESGNCVR